MNIAHQYLKEMGYGEDGQPILIYALIYFCNGELGLSGMVRFNKPASTSSLMNF
ncbi:MAG: hypothetical protein IKI05_04335 [Bacteroidaceae bacterium]|nr:hypothetical protein [Bacteroidaceae bacterium]